MPYELVKPPFTLRFSEMSKSELKAYFEWFKEVLSVRVDQLVKAVHETHGFEQWEPDLTEASLKPLGEWFASQVETRMRTESEIAQIRGQSPIDVPRRELTNRTFSIAFDIAAYLSCVFLKNVPRLGWEQPFGSKKFVDYGQPVLKGSGYLIFNPVRMMVTNAYGLRDKTRNAESLLEIYRIWIVHLKQKEPGGTAT